MYKQTSPLTCIKTHVGAHLQNQNEMRNRAFRNKTMKLQWVHYRMLKALKKGSSEGTPLID